MLFTTTVVKNLLKKPATRNYPFEVRQGFPMYRGELVMDVDKCIFCGMCARKCPSQCITVDKKSGTWTCDPHACVYCGYCRDACPTKCLSMKDVHRAPLTEKIIWTEQGTPPKPKKKAAAKKAEAPKKEAKVEKAEEKPKTKDAPKKAAPQKKAEKK